MTLVAQSLARIAAVADELLDEEAVGLAQMAEAMVRRPLSQAERQREARRFLVGMALLRELEMEHAQ